MRGESPSSNWITATPSVLDGVPRIEGRRLGVYTVATQVADEGRDPTAVADRYDLPVDAVEAAVAYYHSHPEEMAAVEAARREQLVRAQADPAVPTTPSEVAAMVTREESASD